MRMIQVPYRTLPMNTQMNTVRCFIKWSVGRENVSPSDGPDPALENGLIDLPMFAASRTSFRNYFRMRLLGYM